jgi:hypothetical protein
MESSSLPSFTSTSSNIDGLTTIDSRPIENMNWYDGSMETCINQTAPFPNGSSEIREIRNDEILREIDINAVGDEFFLFSPGNTTDDELSNSLSDNKQDKEFEQNESPTHTSKRIFTMENNNSNKPHDFHYSSSNDPFDFDNNNSSIMITNLDDILIDDNDFQNINYRRPIQEDILYEVENENSFSDHSQNTSSIIFTDDKVRI